MNENTQQLSRVREKLHELMAGKLPEKIEIIDCDDLTSQLVIEVNLLIEFFNEISEFIVPLSKGVLTVEKPRTKNFLASPFKELHSQLLNLTWQAQEISKGNFQHRIDFMGDFSKSFNNMVEALDKKTKLLKEEIEYKEKIQKSLLNHSKMLEEANAAKDKFFSIISHDLRSPFSGILGFSELLKNDYEALDDNERKVMIQNIYDSGKTAFNLLENLLIWARSQTNRIEFKPEKLNLSIVVTDIIKILRQQAEIKHIKIITEIKFDTLVIADKNMVETVLRNLVTNAIKFTNQNGKIIISTGIIDKYVKVSIKDNGIGMNEETREKLFSLGSSVVKKGTSGEKGTGLGLLLCKEFIDKHGCNISAESELGKGTTFNFTLPLFDM